MVSNIGFSHAFAMAKPYVCDMCEDGLLDDLSCCGMECLMLSPVHAVWQVA